jgi:transposase
VTGIRRRKIRGHKLTLDDAQVMRIRAALASGATTRALAKRFGVSTTTIKGAAIGRGAYGGAGADPQPENHSSDKKSRSDAWPT